MNTSSIKGSITPDPKSVAHLFKGKKKISVEGQSTRVKVLLQI